MPPTATRQKPLKNNRTPALVIKRGGNFLKENPVMIFCGQAFTVKMRIVGRLQHLGVHLVKSSQAPSRHVRQLAHRLRREHGTVGGRCEHFVRTVQRKLFFRRVRLSHTERRQAVGMINRVAVAKIKKQHYFSLSIYFPYLSRHSCGLHPFFSRNSLEKYSESGIPTEYATCLIG